MPSAPRINGYMPAAYNITEWIAASRRLAVMVNDLRRRIDNHPGRVSPFQKQQITDLYDSLTQAMELLMGTTQYPERSELTDRLTLRAIAKEMATPAGYDLADDVPRSAAPAQNRWP